MDDCQELRNILFKYCLYNDVCCNYIYAVSILLNYDHFITFNTFLKHSVFNMQQFMISNSFPTMFLNYVHSKMMFCFLT